VLDIFNYYVENSLAAYPDAPVGYDFLDRFAGLSKSHASLVAKTAAGRVVGFGFVQPYHPSNTFRGTAMVSYFIHPDHTRKGLGTLMLEHLVEKSRKLGVRCLLANTSSANEASLAFHRKHGFEEVGRFRKIGTKHGTTFDLVWMQKHI
jgi:phosphinothricin acetyltransferase